MIKSLVTSYSRRIELQFTNYWNSENSKNSSPSYARLYLTEVFTALSQFLNTLIFCGNSNYSLASDAYRLNNKGMIKFLDTLYYPLERNHCKKCYYYDVAKARVLLEEHENSKVT